MTTATVLTLHLSMLFGLYELATGLGSLTGRLRWDALIDEIARPPALVLITGLVTFTIGATLVSIHNLWTDALAVVVTLIGWLALIEGLILLAAPGPFLAAVRPLARWQRPLSLAAAVFGALLIIAGFTGRVETIIT